MKEWKCIEGCGDCCGSTPMDKELLKRFEHLAQVQPLENVDLGDWGISPETADGKCVFLNRETGRCVIYPHRPKICREYGQVEKLPCPYIDLKGNKRSPAKFRRMKRIMAKQMKMQVKQLEQIVTEGLITR